MHRLHVDAARLRGDTVVLGEDEHRHLVRVLRLAVAAEVVLFDGEGAEGDAAITRIGPRAVELRVVRRRVVGRAAGPELTLVQALARGDKFDLVVQKATELGVARIVPVAAARSVQRLDEERSTSRRARWQKIAREAARQCGRADVPEVEAVGELAAALHAAPTDALKLLFYEEARHVGLRATLAGAGAAGHAATASVARAAAAAVAAPAPSPGGAPATAERVVIAIGPEGGFTVEEAALARAAGFVAVGLGPRTLRAETAALAALAIVGYALGDLGGA